MMSNSQMPPLSLNTPKKPSIILKVLGFIASCLFPLFKFLKLNSLLTDAEKVYIPKKMIGKEKEPDFPRESLWFRKQRTHNLVLAFLIPLIYCVGFYIAKQTWTSNQFISKGVDKSWELVKQRKFSDAKKKIQLAQSLSPTFNADMKSGVQIALSSLVFAFLFGAYAITRNPLIRDSESFRDIATNLGYIRKDENLKILVTKLGIFFELSPGSSAKEILGQDRLWASLGKGIQIGEHVEDPENRRYVFFKKSYDLLPGDKYGYDQF